MHLLSVLLCLLPSEAWVGCPWELPRSERDRRTCLPKGSTVGHRLGSLGREEGDQLCQRPFGRRPRRIMALGHLAVFIGTPKRPETLNSKPLKGPLKPLEPPDPLKP